MLGDSWVNLGRPNAAQKGIMSLVNLNDGNAGEGVILAATSAPAAQKSRYYRSIDYGVDWLDVGEFVRNGPDSKLTNCENGVIIAGRTRVDPDVERSADYGLTWVWIKRLTLFLDGAEKGCYCGGNTVLIGTNTGGWLNSAIIFKSGDKGLTWDAGTAPTADTSTAVTAMIYLGGGIALAGLANGEIARTVNTGTNWTAAVKDIVPDRVNDFVDLGDGIVLCVGNPSGDIWKSIDYGLNWSLLSSIGEQISAMIKGGDVIFAGGNPDHASVYRSTDNGASWAEVVSFKALFGIGSASIRVLSLVYGKNEEEEFLIAGCFGLTGDSYILRSGESILPPPDPSPPKYKLQVGKYILQCEADKQNLLDCNFTLRQNGGCAEFDFRMGRPDFNIAMGDEVLIYLYGQATPWYRGRILERTRAGSSSPIRNYSGYGHFEFLNGGQLVNVTFSGAGISDLRLAVIHVLDVYVRPYSTLITNSNAKIVDPTHVITALTFDMVKPIDALTDLCDLAEGYEFGVDEIGDFYFRAESTSNLEHKWVGKHVGSFIPTETMRNVVNRWRLEGGLLAAGSNYDSMVEDVPSQGLWGLRSDKATIPSGMNTAETAKWGADLLAKSKDPTLKAVITGIDIERTQTRIWPRGRMRLTSEDGKHTYNFAIRAVTYHITPAGITADVALGPKATHIRDYIADLERKIKKEREQLAIDVYQLAMGTGLVADAIKDWHIDWGTLANQVSAVDVPILDAATYFAATEVEAALAELATGAAIQNLAIKDYHIDWGVGANEVSAVDVPIADAGVFFVATDVEAALQELALAATITIADGGGYYAAANVEDALQELAAPTWLIGRLEAAAGDEWDQQFNNLLKNGTFPSWSLGAALAPDGWILVAGAVDREAGTVRIGAYSCNINSGTPNARIRQDFTNVSFANYGARTFTIRCWVHSDEAAVALIRVSTIGGADVDTDVHSGGGDWECLTAMVTLDAGATGIRVECENDNGGNDHFFDGVILVKGTIAPASAQHPNDEHLKAIDYQSTAPANFDHGLLRMECGQALLTFPGGQNFANIIVTFGTAFTNVLVATGTSISHVGLLANQNGGATTCQVLTNATITQLRYWTKDGTNPGAAVTVTVAWTAIGVN